MAQRGADASERSLGIRRSPIYKRPVVAQLEVPAYARTDASNPQEMRRADAADAALNKQRGYVERVPSITSPEVVTASDEALTKPNAFTNAFGNLGGSVVVLLDQSILTVQTE
jgi:hypothetical protein